MENIELIILAAVAVFVISKLYSVLGQKNGAEQTPAHRFKEAMARAADPDEGALDTEERPRVRAAFTGPAAAGLESIAATDPQFSPEDFTRGARRAYELIVAAYADGDKDALAQLVDEDVLEAYTAAIDERQKTEAEPMRLLRIKTARIAEASSGEDGMGRVSVSFEADLSDGENSRVAREIWTFKRQLSADNPNWLLDEVATAN